MGSVTVARSYVAITGVDQIRMPKPTLGQLRKRRGLSIRTLAGDAKVSPTTISSIEEGITPRFTTIHKLATALGVSIEDVDWPGNPLELPPDET